MSRHMSLCALVLLLGCVATALALIVSGHRSKGQTFNEARQPTSDSEGTSHDNQSPAFLTAPDPIPAGSGEPRLSTHRDQASPGWTLQGAVRTIDGVGACGVRLILGQAGEGHRLHSGLHGAIIADVPQELMGAPLLVDDEAWAPLTWDDAHPDKPAKLVVAPACEVSGQIVDHTGAPVSAGRVHLTFPSQVVEEFGTGRLAHRSCDLNAAGRFTLARVPALDGCALFYSGPHGTASRQLEHPGERGIFWVLAPPDERRFNFTGRVLSPLGQPQGDAVVQLSNRRTVSRSNGTFELTVPMKVIEPEHHLTAYVPQVGGASIPVQVDAGNQSVVVDIRLRAISRARGVLLWEDSTPILDAYLSLGDGCVRVSNAHPAPTLEFLVAGTTRVRTDAEGRFEIDLLEEGEYGAMMSLIGRPGHFRAGVLRAGSSVQVLRVPERAVHRELIIVVLDEGGAPVTGALVATRAVVDPLAAVSSFHAVDEGVTDEQGKCALGVVSSEGVSVSIQLPSGRTVVRPVHVLNGQLMTIRVVPQIKVVVTWSRQYIAGTRLVVESSTGEQLWFELQSAGTTTPTMSLPARRVGSTTSLLADDHSARIVLFFPDGTKVHWPLTKDREGRVKVQL